MAHIHEVIDSDKCFTIDPITRAIVNDAGNKKTQLIQNDHNSERFAFQLPRYIEGHDMSLCDKVEVHYINLDQSSNERSVGVYEVTDLALSEDNESVLLSWLISNNATKYVGVLSFAICFKCMSDDVIEYSWNTAINSSIQIAKGMYNSEIITNNYIDVLEAWKEEFGLKLSGEYLTKSNPEGTGSFSMNRAEGSTVGENSVAFGVNNIASGVGSFASGIFNIAGYYNRYKVSHKKYTTDDGGTINKLSIVNLEIMPDDISINRDVIVLGMNIQTKEIIWLKTTIKTIEQGTDSETGAPVPSLTIDETKITDIDNTIYISLYTKLVDTDTENGPFSAASFTYVEGGFNIASGITSHAEGSFTEASGNDSHAEGYYTKASSEYAHAEGCYTIANGNSSHAEGNHTTTSGDGNSHAEGYYTTASGYNSHAEGYYTEAKGQNSHAEGDHTTTSGYNSHAEGDHTTTSGESSHAEGSFTEASGSYSHAEGYYNLSGGYTKFDAALGSETVDSTINYYIDVANLDTTLISTNDEIYAVVEDNASAEKQICKIIVSSITEYSTTDEVSTVKHKIYFDKNELQNQMSGFPNIKIINIHVKNNNNPYSTHAEGKYTTASGDSSHAEGYLTEASGDYGSHAEGVYTTASGYYGSHAEGEYATASGPVSHAEGYYTTASGDSSHAEGDYTMASGEDSHAEGKRTTASGYASHAEGEYTKASGKYAHAEGYHTTARSNNQHVQGKYNIEDTTSTYAHIVGGGTSNTDRKNIHTLDWNGNAVYSGDVNATDSDGNTVSLLGTKWKLKGNVVNNNTISLPDNYTELKVMTYKTDQEYPIAYTQTILKDMIDVINKNTMQLYCGNTQQYGASWSINKSAKTIQLTNIENTTQVNNCATYLYYR